MQPQNDQWLSLPSGPAVPSYEQPANRPRNKLLRKIALIVIAILVVSGLIAGASVSLASWDRNHAKAAAVQYIGLLNAGKYSQAYKISSSALRHDQTEAQFASNLGDLTAKHPVFSHQSIKLEGGKATYKTTVDGLPPTYSGRTDGIFTIELVRHGLTGWQVDTVDVE